MINTFIIILIKLLLCRPPDEALSECFTSTDTNLPWDLINNKINKCLIF